MIYIFCNAACEFRNYSTGHRFVQAFYAESSFQRSFTFLQSTKDINQWDMNKITYVGYLSAILCTISAMFVIPFSFTMFFFNKDVAFWTYSYWFMGCFILSIIAFFIQVFDSWLNVILDIFHK